MNVWGLVVRVPMPFHLFPRFTQPVCLSVPARCLSIYLSIHLPVCLSIRRSRHANRASERASQIVDDDEERKKERKKEGVYEWLSSLYLSLSVVE